MQIKVLEINVEIGKNQKHKYMNALQYYIKISDRSERKTQNFTQELSV